MIKKIILFCSLFLLFLCPSVQAATSVPMANSQYAYSPVVYSNFNYYYGSYIANLAINTAQNTTSSNAYAARSRTYAYFTSANALRTNRQYQAKMRVCGGSSLWASEVETAVPTKLHWAYNTSQSMTGAIDGNIDDLIMTYTTESSANGGCVNFTFTFTPPVDNLRAVGFWVTYSRLSPVSTCWVADCSNETHVSGTLVDTSTSPGVGNGGSFNIRSFSISYTESGTSTATIEMNQQIMIQQQQQTNQNINNINNNMNDESSPDDETEDLFNNISNSIPAYGPVSSIITMPIALYTAYFNQVDGQCREYNLGSLYGTPLKLPCINLKQKLGNDLWGIIDSFFSIFMIYNICMLIFSCYSAIINLDDSFQSLYTPQHGSGPRVQRGEMEGRY